MAVQSRQLTAVKAGETRDLRSWEPLASQSQKHAFASNVVRIALPGESAMGQA